MTKNKIFSIITHLFLPNRCMFCSTPLAYDQTICKNCAKNAPLTKKCVCLVCEKQNCSCGDKLFTELICPFYYEMGADRAVKDLKFNNNRYNAKKLAIYMASAFLKSKNFHEVDMLIPVPLYHSDSKKRGYNQAELLAKQISAFVGIPMYHKILVKHTKTRKQHELNYRERQANLLDAFLVNNSDLIQEKTVLLIDDVFTTGATMNACTAVLLQSGAKKVACLTAAKTRNRNETTKI